MPSHNWKRILAPTDLSHLAQEAVKYAHGLAGSFGQELHVLHVVRNHEELANQHGIAGTINPDASDDERSQWLATLLESGESIRRVEAVRFGASPADTICDYARKNDIDLIVMATHGRTGLTHLLMGSVTEKVLVQAPCPVLVIRSRQGNP